MKVQETICDKCHKPAGGLTYTHYEPNNKGLGFDVCFRCCALLHEWLREGRLPTDIIEAQRQAYEASKWKDIYNIAQSEQID
jgi:hypothetical protein